MSDSDFIVDQFRAMALEKFRFLEGLGFHRTSGLEESTPTIGTVVYMGNNIGFVFSLDVRDQCVDAEVVKVRDGQLRHNWEGGYSSDIFTHIVKHAGYRGGMHRTSVPGKAAVEQMIDGWAELLKNACQSLLTDCPNALPGRE